MGANDKIVFYEDFGAVGDGVTDDFPAIVACHEYANKNGCSVRANDDATYYLSGKAITAKIMTDTNFGKAKFIIDDRELEDFECWCFEAATDSVKFKPDIKTLKKNQKHVDFPHKGKVYVKVINDTHNIFIRKGANASNGTECFDCFVVDENGNVLNGINWNYDVITDAYAFSVEDKPITIEGGIFTTIANQWESKYDYHARGFNVTRSNVTFKNIEHYIEGEGDHGAPYTAFIAAGECYNTLITDCIFTPHLTYKTESKSMPGTLVNMGTYELNFKCALNLTLRNITQSIDILRGRYWGLMGSNFSKNLVIEDCVISRFDAHCGVTDGIIRNCTFGHAGFNLIGFGEILVENVTIIRREAFINLRSDFGCFFDGKVKIKNCKWRPSGAEYNVFTMTNLGMHDFGYECYMPDIEIDGLYIDDTHCAGESDVLYLFKDYTPELTGTELFPYHTAKTLKVTNIKTETGRKIAVCKNPSLYPHIADIEVE